MSQDSTVRCYSCDLLARENLPVREEVWTVPGWRVATSFNSSLPGWLVVLPTRHVESITELSDEESAVLGTLLRDVSLALQRETGCAKTYVILLAEAPGFNHLHFHVVPRMDDIPEDRKGAAIFAYLKEEPLSVQLQDELALRVRDAIANF
jgi:diadenosine tetraphosphate (Ap4A) HIT family hydrolase